MSTVKTLPFALAGLAIAASYMPVYADNGNAVEIRSLNAPTPADRDLKYHNVDCVVPYCIHNADGSLNHQKSYEAFIKARQQ